MRLCDDDDEDDDDEMGQESLQRNGMLCCAIDDSNGKGGRLINRENRKENQSLKYYSQMYDKITNTSKSFNDNH